MRSTGNRQKSSCVGRKVAQTNHLGQRLWEWQKRFGRSEKEIPGFFSCFQRTSVGNMCGSPDCSQR